MDFVSEPRIAVKMQKMKQRVRWQDPLIRERGIDQTELVLDDDRADESEFSFLVVGDSGSGSHRSHNPQRQIAELLLKQRDDCRFVLHTGDVVYLVGSREYYYSNFISPYREFLVGGESPKQIPFDQMVFNQPFFLVPGNHDYYDLPVVWGALSLMSLPLRRLLHSRIDLDVGLHGSWQGKAYAQAFLDYLTCLNSQQLEQHLDRHYTAKGNKGRCLLYQPNQFTRLPNRYYSFRYGGIDFFALDSNTFNAPFPIGTDKAGMARRYSLEKRRDELDRQKNELMAKSMQLDPNQPEDAEHLDDLHTKLEQLEEMERDIQKQLRVTKVTEIDQEQLDWLQERLIESWQTESVRGRILFFHHPPYVTEATKWDQAQTLAVRYRLRQVLNNVAKAIGDQAQGQPVVDLVLNGHAHCLEYLQTQDTGHADANTNWIVCGGSGYSLRRQRDEGTDLHEIMSVSDDDARLVAKSRLYVGRSGHGSDKHRPYSFIRIDVRSGTPPKFVLRPFVAERYRRSWVNRELPALEIN
ncbi:MAG: metallophosphoesterase [Elainellaceae cyanobacterium]